MVFKPPRLAGMAIGLALLVGLLLVDLILVLIVRDRFMSPLGFGALVVLLASLLALGLVAYRTAALARSRYALSRNALVVEWGGRRLVLPIGEVLQARLASGFKGALRPRGLSWPGNIVGHAEIDGLGPVEFLASTEKAGQVLVRYAGGWLALSPPQPETFVTFLAGCRAEGPEQAVETESVMPDVQSWALWRDRWALGLIGAAAASLLALVGYLSFISSQLPPQLALHFDAAGQPDRFGPPSGLLILPTIASGAWLVNTAAGLWLYRRSTERPASYLLLAAALLMQALVWVATVGLLTAGPA